MSDLDRRFWRLLTATGACDLADGIGRAALPLIATTFTRNPVAVSGLSSFVFLPWLLLALPSGALVDRVDRRHAMFAANVVRAGAVGLLAVLLAVHRAGIGTLYVIAFALGSAETVYDSAVRGLLPDVVAAPDLDRANSYVTVEENVGQVFAGAPLGAALFALALAAPLALNAAGFLVAALLILTLRGNYRPVRAHRAGVREDIVEGVRWLLRHRLLRGLTLVSAGCAFANMMVTAVLVLYVLDVLHLPAAAYGIVLLVSGVGAVAGGLVTPWLAERCGRGPTLVGGVVVTGVAVGAMSLVTDPVAAITSWATAAAGVMTWNVISMSLRQRLVPGELFGRVQGAYRTVVWGAIPLGAMAGGVLAAHAGIRVTFALAGALLVLVSAPLAAIVRNHRDALAEPVAAPA